MNRLSTAFVALQLPQYSCGIAIVVLQLLRHTCCVTIVTLQLSHYNPGVTFDVVQLSCRENPMCGRHRHKLWASKFARAAVDGKFTQPPAAGAKLSH